MIRMPLTDDLLLGPKHTFAQPPHYIRSMITPNRGYPRPSLSVYSIQAVGNVPSSVTLIVIVVIARNRVE
jgi:hypothetical protein